jgi:hypothetical protein
VPRTIKNGPVFIPGRFFVSEKASALTVPLILAGSSEFILRDFLGKEPDKKPGDDDYEQNGEQTEQPDGG